MILSHSFLWFNSFHVPTQTTYIENCVPEFGYAIVKYLVSKF